MSGFQMDKPLWCCAWKFLDQHLAGLEGYLVVCGLSLLAFAGGRAAGAVVLLW